MKIERQILKHPFKCLIFIFTAIYIISLIVTSVFIIKNRLKSIANAVLNTIHQESEKVQLLIKEFSYYHEVTDQINKTILNLTAHNFICVKIFDSNSNVLFISLKSQDKKIIDISNKFEKKYLKKSLKNKYDFFIYKNTLYLILLEHFAKNGYIEVIYKIPENMNKEIKENLIQSLIIISFILLIMFLVAFLLVNYFTQTINRFSLFLLKENIMSLQTMGTMIAKRDSETGEHNYRVTYYAVKIAENMPFNINMQALIKGAFLHDIGKIAIPDNILLKPGKLTEEEFEIMKTHVIHGYEIIKNNEFLLDAVDVVLYHHEKVDGTGYMKGLKKDEIPINARIFAVADVFDALTSERPYKKAFSFEKSMKTIQNDTGKHFCPIVVSAFNKIAKELYNEVQKADSVKLKKIVNEIILKYFSEPS